MLKKIIQKINNQFNSKKNNIEKQDLFELISKRISPHPIIFDIGANKGQTVKKLIEKFSYQKIYAFEPVKNDFEILKDLYRNEKDIICENFALGDKIESKEININKKSELSSFYDINKNSNWIKKRSVQFNTTPDKFTLHKQPIEVITLDDYCKVNNINSIDLLKIDVQGYEDKVLGGSINLLEKNKIAAIILEIILNNNYENYLNISDVEKYLIKNSYRLAATDQNIGNIFENDSFEFNLLYVNTKLIEI